MPGMDYGRSKAYLATGSVAYKRWQVVKNVTGTTLNPAQCAIMVATTDAAVPPLGVCMEDLDVAKVNTGKAFINVALEGNVKAIWDGSGTTPAPGLYVGLSGGTAGTKDGQVTVVAATPGTAAFVIGRILDIVGNSIGQAATAGDWLDIQLLPGERMFVS
jgi:hypothetical protein